MGSNLHFYVRKTGAGFAQSVRELGYGLDDRSSIPGWDNADIFLIATASRPALVPIWPPIQ